MRVSTFEDDPGYINWMQVCYEYGHSSIVITLDGEEVKDCVTADEDGDMGHVIVLKCDKNDRPVIKDNQLCYEKRCGNVKVIIKR